MKFELKKLKIAKQLSEETTAFTAEVWIDGKLAFHAKNSGQGGADIYYKMGDITEGQVNAWLLENHPKVQLCEDLVVDPDLETIVGQLIDRAEAEKQLKRMLKSKIVLIDGQDAVYTVKAEPTPQNCDAALAKNPGCIIVNNPSPELRERVIKALVG